jgi:3-methyladenine DNA glycosylase AlkD
MIDTKSIISHLKTLGNPEIAEHSKVFFKTGAGEYAEGDRFLGIRVPVLRKEVKAFQKASLKTLQSCLTNEFHEIRLFALLVLVAQFKKASQEEQTKIYQLYLNNTQFVNNWDLVDSSAPQIVGAHLYDKAREPLIELAQSSDLWQRRIAIIATFFFIKRDDFKDCLQIAKILLKDSHDLIHKAVGWMLREAGKRDKAQETAFLKQHYQQMPRTMLRYAIERFPETERQAFLKGAV